ncbi:hypothetical protein HK096_003655 [Nowakowskiella sp. JEL0078]|nr:hypothetical protein HK096_003655 [Nowakowskiella sp. JEL0078]
MGKKPNERRNLTKASALLQSNDVPELTNTQKIARVVLAKGGFLYDIELPKESILIPNVCLVSLPARFRNVLWIKRGSFVIVEKLDTGTKVWGDIVEVLLPNQIKTLKANNIWPGDFDDTKQEEHENQTNISDDGVSDDEFVNPNHKMQYFDDDE